MKTNLKNNVLVVLIIAAAVLQLVIVNAESKLSESARKVSAKIEKQKQLIDRCALDAMLIAGAAEGEDISQIAGRLEKQVAEFETSHKELIMSRNPIVMPVDGIITEVIDAEEIRLLNEMKTEWENYKKIIDLAANLKETGELKAVYGAKLPYLFNIYEKLQKSVQENIESNEKSMVKLVIYGGVAIGVMLFFIVIFNLRFFSSVKRFKKELKSTSDEDKVSYISGKYCQDMEDIKFLINNKNNKIETITEAVRTGASNAVESNGAMKNAINKISEAAGAVRGAANENSGTIRSYSEEINELSAKLNELRGIVGAISEYASSEGAVCTSAKEEAENIKSATEKGIEAVKEAGKSKVNIEAVCAAIAEAAVNINIISLNAGIEATRAGEAGKGFEKISDELAKTSIMIRGISKEIRNDLNIIIEKAAVIIEAMADVNGAVDKGYTAIEKTAEFAQEIVNRNSIASAKCDAAAIMANRKSEDGTKIIETAELIKSALNKIDEALVINIKNEDEVQTNTEKDKEEAVS